MAAVRDAFVAIADGTRREILDLLYANEVVTAGEIAAEFEGVSRPAISQHLRVLKECGVVVTFRHGKTQNYSLNPDPINEIQQQWLRKFSQRNVKSLVKLRKIVESDRS